MIYHNRKQKGFVLVVAMILLAVMSLFAVGGMRQASLAEKMSGNYLDRNRAKLSAEQALIQGQTLLRANAVTCLESVCDNTGLVGASSAVASATLPSVWSDANSVAIITAAGQLTSGKFLINALTHANFSKVDCRPYSIMGRGVGLNANSIVVLQTVVYICPTD